MIEWGAYRVVDDGMETVKLSLECKIQGASVNRAILKKSYLFSFNTYEHNVYLKAFRLTFGHGNLVFKF
jgi:hypothetical protein